MLVQGKIGFPKNTNLAEPREPPPDSVNRDQG
jgi:hypothetical protein